VRRQLEYRAGDATPELRAIQSTIQDDVIAVVAAKATDTAG